jgi:hypothetical protein
MRPVRRECEVNPLLRTPVLGLLVAVGTAASLVAGDVHGVMIVVVVMCAALAAGLVASANSVQKKALLSC